MPQFSRRKTQPLKPDSYHRLARLARAIAERLEAVAEGADPRARKSRTDAVNRLHALALHYWHRHHGRNPEREQADAFHLRLREDVERGI